MEEALAKTDRNSLIKIVDLLLVENSQRITVSREELIPFAELLKGLTYEVKDLFIEYILQVAEVGHPQNNLYDVMLSNPGIADVKFQLHQIVQAMLSCKETNESLKNVLISILYTDKVLHPLNAVFTHLLSQSLWTTEEINNEVLFKKLPGKVNYTFADETMQRLNEILGLQVFDLVKEVVGRNEEVSKQRENKAWIEQDKKFLRILYGENGYKILNIDNDSDFEFPYFLNCYLSLFKQIENA
jgi:hypothetical protein